MDSSENSHLCRSRYSAAWKPVGTGILVTLMFLIWSAAGHSHAPPLIQQQTPEESLKRLSANADFSAHRSVQFQLPLSSLRDAHGSLTPNGESFFLLLARRMKSLSLDVTLTSSSLADTNFLVTIAARMMRETPLESTQLSISADGETVNSDPTLTVTITRLVTKEETE